MSLHPQAARAVPEPTARVAKAAFRKGHPYLLMRDAFGTFFADEEFAALFSHRGQPAEAPARLALVTVLQFAEGLSDRQAADAVRSRLDWKYLLGLDLEDPGFDHSLLCEFRSRLIAGSAEATLFERLLTCFRERQLLKARGRQRTDATHVLAAIRGLNRLETVGEAVRYTLNTLAERAAEWLLMHHEEPWPERYGRAFDAYRLPKAAAAREALARTLGADAWKLLGAAFAEAQADSPWAWLWEVPALQILRQVFVQQFTWEAVAPAPGADPTAEPVAQLRFRGPDELPPASQRIHSPYDAAARYGKKRGMSWVGYKAHLTECCDPDAPLLITDVQTTRASTPDGKALPEVHQALEKRDLLPSTHLVDSGYVDAELLVNSQEQYGVDLLGPTLQDTQWQAKEAQGFASSDFVVDWQSRSVACPGGHTSEKWQKTHDDDGNPVLQVQFAPQQCGPCGYRPQCTRSQHGRRLTLRPEAQQRALAAARERERSEAFQQAYAARAGSEGSLSQAVQRCGLRRCRYLGQVKTHLEHLMIAAGLNFVRIAEWLAGTPRAQTRRCAYLRWVAYAT
jgi:transposase